VGGNGLGERSYNGLALEVLAWQGILVGKAKTPPGRKSRYNFLQSDTKGS
jgi:hypothetical protein